jgi:hypothetical protein
MNGILDHAPLATRVAWVRDLFERIDVDSGLGDHPNLAICPTDLVIRGPS